MKYVFIMKDYDEEVYNKDTKKKEIVEGKVHPVCELPVDLNNDKMMEMLKIYLFNTEYEGQWETFTIQKVA